jgi:nitrogen fixation protein FixH
MTTAIPSAPAQRGSWIPWIFVAMFAVVVLVNGTMVWVAASTWTGLETREHYRKGLEYNAALAAERAQAERGWQVAVEAVPAGLSLRLRVEMRGRDGRALDGAEVAALLIRPTSDGHDVAAVLEPVGSGTYAAEMAVPLAGQWDLRIEARHPAGDWQSSRRILVRP